MLFILSNTPFTLPSSVAELITTPAVAATSLQRPLTTAVRCSSGVSTQAFQRCRAANRNSVEHDLAELQRSSAAAGSQQQQRQQQKQRFSSKQDDLAQLNKLLGRLSSGMASMSVG
jgi:C4-dicarboxylate-specific signal transduction histidine kinase